MTKVYACVSGASCSVGLMAAAAHALPFLQLVALVISIAAGIKALRKKD